MNLTREEWLARRRSYLCASEAAAALGMSPWSSPLDVALEKKGGLVAEKKSEILERGIILEPLVAELYAERTGHKLSDGAFVVSAQFPFMAATPDRVEETEDCLAQLKTAINWTRHKWVTILPDGREVDSIPPEYMIQGQHEMAVTGARKNIFGVLFADASTFRSLCWMVAQGIPLPEIAAHVGQLEAMEDPPCAFAIRPLERDDALIAQLVEQERIFWERHVLGDELPPDKYAREKAPTILEADARHAAWMKVAREHWIARRDAEDGYEEMKTALTAFIGDATGIHADGVGTITYKAPVNVKPVTDWHAVLEAVKAFVPADRFEAAVEEHTATPKKSRVFLPKWEGVARKSRKG